MNSTRLTDRPSLGTIFLPHVHWALGLAFALFLTGICPSPAGPAKAIVPAAAATAASRLECEPIKPIPLSQRLDSRKVALGEALFREERLSRDNTVSCASCHDLAKGGVDRRVRSIGIDQKEGAINAPTVFNSSLNFKQFWDGRAASLEAQVDGPLLHPNEMGSTWAEIVGKLSAVPFYVSAFREIFPDGIQPQNIRSAIAEFERSLTTPNSRFDQYLRGNDAALTAEEKAGYQEFKSHGCTSCHQGINIGGNMFETFGAMADYFGERGHVTSADLGRFNVTGREADRFVFKVPSLRNVALTAPYFHDGSAPSLKEAVKVMGTHQLGQMLSDAEIDLIVKFLLTLTGEYGGKPL